MLFNMFLRIIFDLESDSSQWITTQCDLLRKLHNYSAFTGDYSRLPYDNSRPYYDLSTWSYDFSRLQYGWIRFKSERYVNFATWLLQVQRSWTPSMFQAAVQHLQNQRNIRRRRRGWVKSWLLRRPICAFLHQYHESGTGDVPSAASESDHLHRKETHIYVYIYAYNKWNE